MHLAERFVDGGYVVYAAALETHNADGFHAAVVVKQTLDGQAGSREVFREEQLVHGSVWRYPNNALAVAVVVGLAVAHQRREAAAEQGSPPLAPPDPRHE